MLLRTRPRPREDQDFTVTTRPLLNDAVVTTNSGLGNTFDAGDVFKVVCNEEMAAPGTGDTIRATDGAAGGTAVADCINGSKATFSLNTAAETVNGKSCSAGTALTVTLTAALSVGQGWGHGRSEDPGHGHRSVGQHTDLVGNTWNISG